MITQGNRSVVVSSVSAFVTSLELGLTISCRNTEGLELARGFRGVQAGVPDVACFPHTDGVRVEALTPDGEAFLALVTE